MAKSLIFLAFVSSVASATCGSDGIYQAVMMNQKFYEAAQTMDVTTRLSVIAQVRNEAVISTCPDVKQTALEILKFPSDSKLQSIAGPALEAVAEIAVRSNDDDVKIQALENLRASVNSPVFAIRKFVASAIEAIVASGGNSGVQAAALRIVEKAQKSPFIDVRANSDNWHLGQSRL